MNCSCAKNFKSCCIKSCILFLILCTLLKLSAQEHHNNNTYWELSVFNSELDGYLSPSIGLKIKRHSIAIGPAIPIFFNSRYNPPSDSIFFSRYIHKPFVFGIVIKYRFYLKTDDKKMNLFVEYNLINKTDFAIRSISNSLSIGAKIPINKRIYFYASLGGQITYYKYRFYNNYISHNHNYDYDYIYNSEVMGQIGAIVFLKQ